MDDVISHIAGFLRADVVCTLYMTSKTYSNRLKMLNLAGRSIGDLHDSIVSKQEPWTRYYAKRHGRAGSPSLQAGAVVAAVDRRLDVMRYLVRRAEKRTREQGQEPVDWQELMYAAARGGSDDVFRYVLARSGIDAPDLTRCVSIISEHDHVGLARTFDEIGWLDVPAYTARDLVDPPTNRELGLKDAALHGSVNLVAFFIGRCSTRAVSDALSSAVEGGHVECVDVIMEHMRSHHIPVAWMSTLGTAAKCGHLSLVVRFEGELREANCTVVPLNTAAIVNTAAIAAAKASRVGSSCHLDVVRYLMSRGADRWLEMVHVTEDQRILDLIQDRLA